MLEIRIERDCTSHKVHLSSNTKLFILLDDVSKKLNKKILKFFGFQSNFML